MTVRSNSTPLAPRDDGDAPDDPVVWPEPSPLSGWWQQVMALPPADDRPASVPGDHGSPHPSVPRRSAARRLAQHRRAVIERRDSE